MNRRHLLCTLTALAGSLLATARASAQTGQSDAVVPAAKIVDALRGKDIVVDRPGAPGAARPEPGIDLRVPFTFGSADMLPQGKRQLDQLALALGERDFADVSFMLAGHTDAVGGLDANMRLSLQRAEAVRSYLMQAHGVAAARLHTVGHGPTRLADPANPQSAVNRRVEVRRLRAAPGLVRAPAADRFVPTPAR